MSIVLKKILLKFSKPFIKLLVPRDYWEESIFSYKRKLFGDVYLIAEAGLSTIDTNQIDDLLKKKSRQNPIKPHNQPSLIVSLTSFPERILDVKYTLFSLSEQTVKPDKIILWLAKEEFPDGVEKLATEFSQLSVEVRTCTNLKSYKKLIPTLQLYPNAVIVTADDDIYYEQNWLELLLEAYQKQPHCIHCHNARKITFTPEGTPERYRRWKRATPASVSSHPFGTVAIGCGGILYPPGSLHEDVMNKQLFLELAPLADDLWFWAMATMKGTKVNVVEGCSLHMTYVNPARELGLLGKNLWHRNVWRRYNDKQFKRIVHYYGLLKTT